MKNYLETSALLIGMGLGGEDSNSEDFKSTIRDLMKNPDAEEIFTNLAYDDIETLLACLNLIEGQPWIQGVLESAIKSNPQLTHHCAPSIRNVKLREYTIKKVRERLKAKCLIN